MANFSKDEDFKKKIKKIKAVIFDADGVLFSGRVFVHPETGEMFKERSHVDGQGISLLRDAGIRIVFVTGEKTGFLQIICNKMNSLPSVVSGKWPKIDFFMGLQGADKVKAIDEWLQENKINWQECVAMGDDVADYQILKRAGIAVAPVQAEKIIKGMAHYITEREGGNGAIRDLCNLILEVKGINQITSNFK